MTVEDDGEHEIFLVLSGVNIMKGFDFWGRARFLFLIFFEELTKKRI